MGDPICDHEHDGRVGFPASMQLPAGCEAHLVDIGTVADGLQLHKILDLLDPIEIGGGRFILEVSVSLPVNEAGRIPTKVL